MRYDAVAIVTDHFRYDYPAIAEQSQVLADTRNATTKIDSSKVIRCRGTGSGAPPCAMI